MNRHMKKIVFSLLFFTVYCNHQNPAGTQDERGGFKVPVIIESGSYDFFNIGDSAEKCYRNLQNMYENNPCITLSLALNDFENTSNLSEIIPLYNSVSCYANYGKPSGINVTFRDKMVSSIILNNNGENLSVWPLECDNSSCINVGDDIRDAACDIVTHSDKLTIVRLSDKNLSMPFDTNMKNISEWYYRRGIFKGEAKLVFVNAMLKKIIFKEDNCVIYK